ncbi:MAG TPA: DUF1800 domain-containing protein [Bryobacteraceae bacterium]|nr:DUF1800 domain-containing protein [Bryobacteraceae bacterium]
MAAGTVGADPFRQPLSPADQVQHALDRLTFGPRSADQEQIKKLGVSQWIDRQLNPEQIPENPDLTKRLQPYTTLQLSGRELFADYPGPAQIAAIAHGKLPLSTDPKLRTIETSLIARYQARKTSQADQEKSDGEAPEPLSKEQFDGILTPDQVDDLRHGVREAKEQVLSALQPDKMSAFIFALRPEQRRRLLALAPIELRREMLRSINPQSVTLNDLVEDKVLRAVYSNRQLDELLVDFWFNHFNVNINKNADHFLVTEYERDAIRPHVLGHFYDLLLATAQSPAMLVYLDNAQSVGPNAPGGRGLNENYGRELMELHTLGVDGGYTQKDVTEVARCFTGWSISGRPDFEFKYKDRLHDKGQKVVLGHLIPAGGGMEDGLQVLKILSRQPATAHFISRELAQRFVADNPPASLVDRMAKTFLKTDGDLKEVMRTMLSSSEFWSEGAYQAKMKTPFEMIVSSVRATGANVSSAFLLGAAIQRLGEPLYRKVEPTGYSYLNSEWVSSAALVDRMNFAIKLAHDQVPGVTVDTDCLQATTQSDALALARRLLGHEPLPATKDALLKNLAQGDPGLIAGLALGSPEFQRH